MAFYPENKAPLSALAVGAAGLGVCSVVLIFAGPLLGVPAVVMGVMALMVIRKGEPVRRGKGLAGLGIGTGLLGTVLPILILVAWPGAISLDRSKELLNRLADAKGAEVLVHAARSQARVNEGQMPPNLAAVLERLPNHQVLLSKSSKTPPLPPIRGDATWQEIAGQVDASCDYVYVGADVNLTGLVDAGQVIVLYSKGDVYPDHGRLVGFADGHVQWVSEEELAGAFGNSNRQRASLNLPAVAMDGPPPLPVVRTAATLAAGTQAATAAVPKVIETAADAIAAIKTEAFDQRQAAIGFLLKTPADADNRREVSMLLEQCVADPRLRLDALTALQTWGTKENVPGLIKRLTALKDDDPTESSYILRALGGTGDVDHVADLLAKTLTKDATRRSATEALVALGPGVEPVVIPYLDHRDPNVGRAACSVLAQVGTARSVAALKDVSPRNPGLKRDAEEAVKAIQARIGAEK